MLFIVMLHCNGSMLALYADFCDWHYGSWSMILTRAFIQSLTCIGVNIFVLISGYFSIRPSLKALARLFFVLWFFCVGCYLLNCGVGNEVFTFRHLCKISLVFSRYDWFVQCYLFLFLLSPMLNILTETLSQRKMTIYLCVFLLCEFYFGCVWESENFYFNKGYSVTHFMLIYLIGRYLNKYGLKEMECIKNRWLLMILFLCIGILMVGRLTLRSDSPFLEYASPIVILESIVFFVLFSRFQFQSKAVNWIASSTFAVYVFHTHEPICSYMWPKCLMWLQGGGFATYLTKTIIMVVLVFVIAILLDKIRQLIFAPLIAIVSKMDDKILNKLGH